MEIAWYWFDFPVRYHSILNQHWSEIFGIFRFYRILLVDWFVFNCIPKEEVVYSQFIYWKTRRIPKQPIRYYNRNSISHSIFYSLHFTFFLWCMHNPTHTRAPVARCWQYQAARQANKQINKHEKDYESMSMSMARIHSKSIQPYTAALHTHTSTGKSPNVLLPPLLLMVSSHFC